MSLPQPLELGMGPPDRGSPFTGMEVVYLYSGPSKSPGGRDTSLYGPESTTHFRYEAEGSAHIGEIYLTGFPMYVKSCKSNRNEI